MRIDPLFAALRGDPAPQRIDQEAVQGAKQQWLSQPNVAQLFAGLAAYGEGVPLNDCAALGRLFASHADAAAFVDGFIAAMVSAMRAAPLGHVPFRQQYSGGYVVQQLGSHGRAVLSLVMVEGEGLHRREPPASLCFVDSERHEMVLAGSAKGRIVRRAGPDAGPVALTFEAARIEAGQSLSLCGPRTTRLLDHVAGRLVSLRLSRVPETPEPSREYRLNDGVLLHQAAGDRQESRVELAMALLGKMGRQDAAPAIAVRARSGSDHLRWQALRECLALNAREGFRALTRVACDQQDVLAGPAGSLRAQLLETYPQFEEVACLA